MRIIVAAPLVAVVGFAGIALANSARQAQQAGELGARARLASDAGALAYQLQRERAAAADLLISDTPGHLEAFARQTGETDDAITAYRLERGRLPGVPAATEAVLDRIDGALSGLAPMRARIRTAEHVLVSATTFSYRILVADLLSYRESTAQGAPTPEIADDIRAAAELSKAVESVGQLQVAVLRAVAAGQLTQAMQQDIAAARTSFTESSLAFLDLARPEWQVWWEQAGRGDVAIALQRLQDEVSRASAGDQMRLDTGAWIATTLGWSAKLFAVQQDVDAAVRSEVDAARLDRQRRALIEAGAMFVALVLTVVVTSAVARQITRRLRRLRDAANTVAFKRLPAIVSDLRSTDATSVDPERLAIESAAALDNTGRDEIGEVGQAFNEVHKAAVRTAAEQAVMRANTAEIFIHLSRREQRLVDAVLAQVDKVEQDETDPDRLARLYTLDHLATRMARINASLLVLGGVGVGRVRRDNVPLPKVMQAALSQIEYYTRIRLGVVDADVAVVPEAVDEVVHLLAELMDNATSYSPPETEVWATARALGDRVIAQISDEGVGLAPQRLAQLNDLLSRPPAVDMAAVRAMGLMVVGQLANRLGAAVELRPGPRLGTIAEVTLPASLIRRLPPEAQLPVLALPPTEAIPYELSPRFDGANGNGNGNGYSHGYRHDPYQPTHEPPLAPIFRASSGAPLPPRPSGGRPDRPDLSRPDLSRPDQTQELPIFQEVNSWFRAGQNEGEPAAAWRTPADEGWQAAAASARPEVVATTKAGLSMRIPQRHLVPGGVGESGPGRVDRRDPTQVAAAMAAYARGVAGRRSKLAQASTARDSVARDQAARRNGEQP